MITERDKKALYFISMFRLVTAEQVNRYAYGNIKICYKRLQKLHADSIIYRERNTVNMGYVFSSNRIRSVRQFMHDSIRTEFFLKLNEVSEVTLIEIEKVCGKVRPDGVFFVKYKGRYYSFLLEVETLSNRSLVNYSKYNDFFLKEWKEYFDEKPTVIYCTDKAIDEECIKFEYRHISPNLSNFMDIFNEKK